MTEFTIALAGVNIHVSAVFPKVRYYCREYLTEEPADIFVQVSMEDLRLEQERSAREDIKEGKPVQDYPPYYLETLAVYRKIALAMLDYNTILFHGSAICVDGEAFLFTAKSGTGKSTHTRLWREHFGNRAVMVNDDKPLLKIQDNQVFVCGTPWNGKHGLGANMMAPLKGICILTRAEENSIQPISVEQALPMLLQQSYRPPNPVDMGKLLKHLETVSKHVGLYLLGCNMDPQAAVVAYEGMKGR